MEHLVILDIKDLSCNEYGDLRRQLKNKFKKRLTIWELDNTTDIDDDY